MSVEPLQTSTVPYGELVPVTVRVDAQTLRPTPWSDRARAIADRLLRPEAADAGTEAGTEAAAA
ncbi:hypothetical protein [Streptomyces platensis]|uniref:hypothetical protein n=1 Tax=Streptomyces platensis TaxID=58346 RepID=UPI002ED592F4